MKETHTHRQTDTRARARALRDFGQTRLQTCRCHVRWSRFRASRGACSRAKETRSKAIPLSMGRYGFVLKKVLKYGEPRKLWLSISLTLKPVKKYSKKTRMGSARALKPNQVMMMRDPYKEYIKNEFACCSMSLFGVW